jgi:hypothetical protein
LLEIPIAPLCNRFDLRFLFWPVKRKDHHGIHMENSVDRVWKTEMVIEAVNDLLNTARIFGIIRYVPSWSLDRTLGLFVQAKFFDKGAIIGHWMPEPAQFCKSSMPSSDIHGRFYLASDVLLIKRFPQYGYFWNLVFSQLWAIPIRGFRFLLRKK